MAQSLSSNPASTTRIAAIVVIVLSCLAATNGAATLRAGGDWTAAWTAVSALYTVMAVGLWRGAPWARGLALGGCTWGLVVWVQSAMACLGGVPIVLGVIAGHVAVVGLLGFATGELPGRHRAALVLAGAALPGALVFGLAPLHGVGLRALLVGGAGLLFAMSVGLARGRTWGLLAGLVAAPLLVCGAWWAPSTVSIATMMPMLPETNTPTDGVLLLRLLGMSSAVLAVCSLAPLLGPAARFVRASGRPSNVNGRGAATQ